MSLYTGDESDVEEERRLCYVAITRARETLTLTHARQRMLYGKTNASLPSRFLNEIPTTVVERKGAYRSVNQYAQMKQTVAVPSARSTDYLIKSTQKETALPDISKGDMIYHKAFGKGLVLSVVKMGGDALLEIAFDQIGTKKLMAKTASAHMKKL